MAISTLYRQYFQKSKIFVYPLLDIKRGSSVTPVQTYFGWNDKYTPEDAKYITVYQERDDNEYKNFMNNVLLKHTRICDYHKTDDGQVVLVFDFSDIKADWLHLIDGRYSKMNSNIKRKIRDHFDKTGGHYIYIDSYLFPEKYFSIYSELLQVDEVLLKSVGELCTKPDLEKEILYQDVQELQKTNILD